MSVALITGAAHGIGRAIAERFLREGRTVVLLDNNRAAGRRTVQELSRQGSAFFLPLDVSNASQVRGTIRTVLKRWKRLDVLINNAGIFHHATRLSPPAVWTKILGINLTGTYLMAHEAADALKRTRGSIVNLASTRALMSEPGTEAYAATKGGIVALTHALAISLGPDVRVNSISPGWIDTTGGKTLRPKDHAQHPVGRVGRPEDVAALASYLVSADAGFVTGQNFIIDGGMTRKMIYEA